MTNRTFYTAKLNLALTISFLKLLPKCYKTYVGRFLIKNQVLGPWTLWHQFRRVSIFCTGAELSTRHYGTSAKMVWVRSVLGQKCPYTLRILLFSVESIPS